MHSPVNTMAAAAAPGSAAGARTGLSSEPWALNGLDVMMKCFCPLRVRSYDWVGVHRAPKALTRIARFFSTRSS
jgi:hypothetical protein